MKHLKLELTEEFNGKRCWKVFSKHENTGKPLAHVGWYSPWKKFALYPEAATIFEEVCLRDLALFIEDETKREKAAKKPKTKDDRNPYLTRELKRQTEAGSQ